MHVSALFCSYCNFSFSDFNIDIFQYIGSISLTFSPNVEDIRRYVSLLFYPASLFTRIRVSQQFSHLCLGFGQLCLEIAVPNVTDRTIDNLTQFVQIIINTWPVQVQKLTLAATIVLNKLGARAANKLVRLKCRE